MSWCMLLQVLKDDTTLEDNKVLDNGFMVVMVTKVLPCPRVSAECRFLHIWDGLEHACFPMGGGFFCCQQPASAPVLDKSFAMLCRGRHQPPNQLPRRRLHRRPPR